jgi:hypothetical protein
VAWAEHLIKYETTHLSDEQLAALVGLKSGAAGKLQILRHASGFVVLAPGVAVDPPAASDRQAPAI